MRDPVQHIGLQKAVAAGDHIVCAACVKAGNNVPVRRKGHRILYFIAVTLGQGTGQNGQHGNFQPANAGKSIGHKALLGGKLGLIAQMPKAASAAGAIHRAVRLHTAGAGGF